MLQKRWISHALIAMTATLALYTAVAVAPAMAGTYTVPFCDHSPSAWTGSWSNTQTGGASAYFYNDSTCSPGGGYVYRRSEVWSLPGGASNDFTFNAPAGTYISQLDMYVNSTVRGAGYMHGIYSWQEDSTRNLTAAALPGQSLQSKSYWFPLSGSKVVKLRDSLACTATTSCSGLDNSGNYGIEEYWGGAVVHLVDPSLPTFESVSGGGWKSEPLDGQHVIDYAVADTGAGVKETTLVVDGVVQATKAAGCSVEGLVPCPLTTSGRFTLDTTKLSEGTHDLELRLVDGAQNPESKRLAIMVRRAPVAIPADSGGRPVGVTDTTWSGSDVPAVGDTLRGSQGTWNGTGLSFAYQWMRCDASGTNCDPIPGATAVHYMPTTADVGHSLQFCVTATNSGGSATRCSSPTPAVVSSHPTTTTGGGTTANTADPNERPGEAAKPTTSIKTPSTPTGDRGQPNGSPASDKVVLTALVNNRSSTMKVKFGKRVPIGGKLLGPDGTPIAGAILEVQTRTAVPGASVADAGKIVTGSDGRFKYVAPAGPSRVIRIAYRSHTGDTSFADTSDLTLMVTAGVTINATPTTVRNRHATVFTGRLLGKPVSKRGVVVDLQVFFRNKWRTFGAPRTDRAGRYRFKYRFMAGAATWKFRARVRRESSYPYIEGYSAKTVKVQVVN